MAEKIIWYVQNKHNLLSVHDQLLAQFNVTQVHNTKRAQKSEWIRHLDVAQEDNTKDQTQRSKTATCYYKVHGATREPI